MKNSETKKLKNYINLYLEKKPKKNKQLKKILNQYYKLTFNKNKLYNITNLYDLVIQIIKTKETIFINCFDITGELLISSSEGKLGIKRIDRLSPYSGRKLAEFIIVYLKNKLIANQYNFSNLIIIIKNYTKSIENIISKIESEFLIKKIILQAAYAFNGSRKKKRKRK